MQKVVPISLMFAHLFFAASCVVSRPKAIKEKLIERVPECQTYWPIVSGRFFLGTSEDRKFLVDIPFEGEIKTIRMGNAEKVVYDNKKGTVIYWNADGEPGGLRLQASGEKIPFRASPKWTDGSKKKPLKWTVSPGGKYIILVHGENNEEQRIEVRKPGSERKEPVDVSVVGGVKKVFVDDHGRVVVVLPKATLLLRILDSGRFEFCGLWLSAPAVFVSGHKDGVGFAFGAPDRSSGTKIVYIAGWPEQGSHLGSLEIPIFNFFYDIHLPSVYSDFLAFTKKGIVGVSEGRLKIFRAEENAGDKSKPKGPPPSKNHNLKGSQGNGRKAN